MHRRRARAAFACVSLLVGAIAAGPREAAACDLCAIYTATVMHERKTGPWIGVSEQFTSFNTIRDGDGEIDDPHSEWVQSSITQLVFGWAVHPRFGVQLNVPIVSREFSRNHDGIEHDDENGLGDISFIGRLNAYERVSERSVLRLDLFAGLKMPSGDSERLGEELEDAHVEEPAEAQAANADTRASGPSTTGSAADPPQARPHHEGHEQSGVHGHDLALGSGSVDGVFGLTGFASWRRAFFEAGVQYFVRGDGDFDYTYADDLLWNGGPGAFLWLGHDETLALQAQLTGESKGKDHQAGERLGDTAITALYLGPRLMASFSDSLHGDLGAEWPLLQHVSGVQIVPDWRVRAGLTWRF
jgi:hypothetical protein